MPEQTSPPSILLVDDDPDFRLALSKQLRRAGYQVVEAEDGRKAARILEADAGITVLISDLVMPEKDGIELIMQTRRTRPGVKIIAISGLERDHAASILNAAESLGACRTLAKPFPFVLLHESIQLALRHNPHERAVEPRSFRLPAPTNR